MAELHVCVPFPGLLGDSVVCPLGSDR